MLSRRSIRRERVGHGTRGQSSVYTVTNISKQIDEENERTYISVVTLSCRAPDATVVVVANVFMALTALLASIGTLGVITDSTDDEGNAATAVIEMFECKEAVEFRIGREATGAVALVFIKDAVVVVEPTRLAMLEYGVVFARPNGAGWFAV